MELILKITYGLTILLVVLIQAFVEKFSRKGMVLGVGFSDENLDREEIQSIGRFYTWSTLGFGVFTIGLMWILTGVFLEDIGLQSLVLLALIFLNFTPLIYWNHRLKKLKADWGDSVDERILIETSYTKERFNLKGNGLGLYLIPLLIVILGTVYIFHNYQAIPDPVPVHMDFFGRVDGYRPKGFWSVYFLPLTNFFLLGVIFLANLAYLMTRQRLEPGRREESLIGILRARRIWTGLHFLSALALVASLQYMGYLMLFSNKKVHPEVMWLSLLPSILIVIAVLVLGRRVGMAGEKLSSGQERRAEGSEENWYLGATIYYNPDDPAIFVNKRIGIGTTVNLGSAWGKLILGGILLVSIGPLVWLLLQGK